jgi:hypothetical protein
MKPLVTLLLLLELPAAQTPSSEIEVRAELSPDSAQVGEVLTLIVTVSGIPENAEVVLPELPDTGVVAALAPPQWLEGSREGSSRAARYQLAAWDVGELRVPAAELRVVTSATELAIPLPDVTVNITSVLPSDADPDTLAYRPPADVVGSNWSLQEKLAGAALALALMLSLVVLARRRGANAPMPIPAGPPPKERAQGALARLEASGLLEAGELKAFYSALSQILREFLADTEAGWRLDLTTPELIAAVGADGVEATSVLALGELLLEADLVKFARHRPSRTEVRASLDSARDWIVGFERVLPTDEADSTAVDATNATSLDDLFVISEDEIELSSASFSIDPDDSQLGEDEGAGTR